MKTGFPLWLPVLIYLIVALVFPSPLLNALGLFCAIVLFLASTTIGAVLSRWIQNGHKVLHFPLGLGILLLVVFAIGSWNASRAIMTPVWCGLLLLALGSLRELNVRVPLYTLWGLPYFLLLIWSSFTPTIFYDSLAYNLGLPYQYLSAGRFLTFAEKSTSFFPPLDQVCKYLFLSISPLQNGIKLFSLLLYLHTLRILVDLKPEDVDARFIVIPLLLFPVPWILMHLINPDLLVCVFFLAGVCAILKVEKSRGNVLLAVFPAALLCAFSAWTKYTIYPFLLVLPILFVNPGDGFKTFLKKSLALGAILLLLLSPLMIRNFILKRDPFYPMLAPLLSTDWQDNQIAAVKMEFPTPKNWQERIKAIFLTPVLLTFSPKYYGSASEVGMLPLVALVAVPFYIRKIRPAIVIFAGVCYGVWVLQLYQFRYFLPVFLFLSVWLAYSFQLVTKLIRKAAVLWIVAIATGMFLILPLFRFFPLLSPKDTFEAYLSRHLTYWNAARFLNEKGNTGKALLLGETRTAYFSVPLIAPSYADQHPLLQWAKISNDSEHLYRLIQQENIRWFFYNPSEMQRLAQKYRIWQATQLENEKIIELLRNHGKLVYSEQGFRIISFP